MAWRFNNPFRKGSVETVNVPMPPQGWNAPLHIAYAFRDAPQPGGAARYAYLTELQPRYTPIGGGIPNQRDIGTAPPAWSSQGVGVQQIGSPGILAGAFVSGPLTNTSAPGGGDIAVSGIAAPGEFTLPEL